MDLIQTTLVVFVLLDGFVAGAVVLDPNLSQVTQHHPYQVMGEVPRVQESLKSNRKPPWRVQAIVPEGLVSQLKKNGLITIERASY